LPEIPDLTVYVEALESRLIGRTVERIRIASPTLLRTVEPPIERAQGRTVTAVRRLAKRVVLALEPDLFLVIHLMVAGRFRWRSAGAAIPRRGGLAAFDFDSGTLLLVESSSRKRASLHFVAGERGLEEHDPGGLEVLDCDLGSFAAALTRESHTLKRALTDPRLLSGIGNAYSDEILHRAKLSPVRLSTKLEAAEIARLYEAARETLTLWTERLRREADGEFPEKVTAFRDGMAVHGRFRKPCPDCGAPVQRIVYASSETNYCAPCQTGGKLLADRALSRLLKRDWPRSIDALEQNLREKRQETTPARRNAPR
jgi:formamidopyrimidine-DNA glycosylase